MKKYIGMSGLVVVILAISGSAVNAGRMVRLVQSRPQHITYADLLHYRNESLRNLRGLQRGLLNCSNDCNRIFDDLVQRGQRPAVGGRSISLRDYCYPGCGLIEEALVREYGIARGLRITPAEIEKELEGITSDEPRGELYPGDVFEGYGGSTSQGGVI